MVKKIVYNESARKALEKGMLVLAKAASVTLGPKGRNVVVQGYSGSPQITNDGATIVKAIELSDQLENIGVALLRQAALKTNMVAGDGTTTATVLAYAIVREGIKSVDSGLSPLLIKKGISKAVHFAVDKLLDYSLPIEKLSDIVHIASVSAGNDSEIGLMIAKAIKKVGREGVISLEEGCLPNTYLEISEGLRIEQGFMSSRFLLHTDTIEICQDNPMVLLIDSTINHPQDLVPLLEQAASLGRSLLIIAKDISQPALAMLVMNRLKGIVDVVAVRAPGFGATSSQILEDLAALTLGRVISDSLGLDLSDISLDFAGSAERIIISQIATKIVAGLNSERVHLRCRQISKQIDLSTNAYDKQKLQSRLSKLKGGAALIKVGASTESEMKYKKLRFEDAINASKAALDEGVVPGGGSALIHIARQLDLWADNSCISPEELAGARIISRALSLPLATIAENSGLSGHLITQKVRMTRFPMGYDANNNTIADMYNCGIIDSTKVIRLALQNSSSLASTILTTECIISDYLVKTGLH